jgi:hypothetical protein
MHSTGCSQQYNRELIKAVLYKPHTACTAFRAAYKSKMRDVKPSNVKYIIKLLPYLANKVYLMAL